LPVAVDGETRWVIALLARAPGGVSPETRARAALLAALLGLIGELDLARARADHVEDEAAGAPPPELEEPGGGLRDASRAVLELRVAVATIQTRLLQLVQTARGEHRRLENRLARAERQAAIGRLAGSLAHEIRNPLTVVGTTIQYLRDRLPPEHEHRVLLQAADRKVREMDESLEGLLSLSRPLELQPRPTDIAALLGEVAAAIAGRASRQSVDVAVEAEPSLRHVLDRRLIEQVVLTLALGALDAMPGRGRLVLAARRAPDGSLVLTVADAGAALDDAG